MSSVQARSTSATDQAWAMQHRRAQVMADGLQPAQRPLRIPMHPGMGHGVGPQPPAPHRALVVGPIPRDGVAAAVALVGMVAGIETAQAMGREQPLAADRHHLPGLLRGEELVGQRHRQELIRTQRLLTCAVWPIQHVKAKASVFIPETLEALARLLGKGVVGPGGEAGQGGEAGEGKGAIPTCTTSSRAATSSP